MLQHDPKGTVFTDYELDLAAKILDTEQPLGGFMGGVPNALRELKEKRAEVARLRAAIYASHDSVAWDCECEHCAQHRSVGTWDSH